MASVPSAPTGGRRDDDGASVIRLSGRNIGAVVGALAALVAVMTGALAILFEIAPGLRPRDPPARLSAEVSGLLVDRNVTLGEYAVRVKDTTLEDDLRQTLGDDFATFRRAFLGRRGLVVYVQIRSEGLDDPLQLPTVHLYSARTGRRLGGEQRERVLDGRRSECAPRADDDQCVTAVFKLCHAHEQRIRIRVELRDSDDRLMDLETTRAIRCEAV